MEHFTQTDEQPVILRELADIPNGRFLDIGAHDGQTLSNTRALALLGWWGTLVEPNPHLFLDLLKRYGNDERFTLINAAMSDKSGLTDFFYDSHGPQFSSSISSNAKELFPHLIGSPKFKVNAISPKDLTGDFDFVSIDTEGHDLLILKSMRGRLDKTRLVCIEHTQEASYEGIIEELRHQRFEQVHKSRENIIARKV